MHDLEDRTTTQPVDSAPRRRLSALLIVGALAVTAVVAWLLVRGGGDQSATDVIQEYAAAMRADDMGSVAGFDASTVDGGFIEWQIAMNLVPVFTDCSELVGADVTRVSCLVKAGDGYFYSVIAGKEMSSTVSGSVDEDGVFSGETWPPPEGLMTSDAEFREWVRSTYPELEDQMWGAPGYLGLKMTRESGELRMQLLDEYLASR